ncbi:MAG: MerR family transcriptional regulator [Caldilineaceae bacterium]
MHPSKDTPIFNLKAVVQETGIKPDTLRAWERRYDLPKPQRTESGHRLYSQNDVDMLHWLLARQNEGLSISRAIEMWQHLQQNGNSDPAFASTPLTSVPIMEQTRRAVAATLGIETTIAEMTEQWVKACMSFDQPVADQILSQAFALFSTETVCFRLIQQGLNQIGEGWFRGTATVQQEHFASSIAIRRIDALLAAAPPPTQPNRILVCNPPEEEHTFIPLMLSLVLRRQGWDVVYLGANVPLASLDSTLLSVKPDLVILTAQQLHTAATLYEMSQLLFRERVPLAYGGQVFTNNREITKVIPGYFLGERAEEANKIVEHIMNSLRLKPAQRIVPKEFQDAHLHFQERRAAIEADLWNQAAKLGIGQRELNHLNEWTGRSFSAAIQLGNLDYVENSIEWIKFVLTNHYNVSGTTLNHYFDEYCGALYRHMDNRGVMISQWLAVYQSMRAGSKNARHRMTIP